MTKILITNAYTWYNKGDASIVKGMIYAIRRCVPEADITILSFTPGIDQVQYAEHGVTVLRSLLTLAPEGVSSRPRKAVALLLKMLKCYLWARIRIPVCQEEREILKAYLDSDVIVSCGGGFLGGREIASIVHLFGIYFGKFLGKPVVIYGQSIEPFGNLVVSAMTRFVLNRVDLITVREPISQRYLHSLGLRSEVVLTADAAFLVPSVSADEAARLLADEGICRSSRPLVGITVRHWSFPGQKCAAKRLAKYITAMAETIEHLVSDFDATVVFCPQVIHSPADDDRLVSQHIASKVHRQDRVTVLTKDYSPGQLKALIGQMDLFLGTRMHSNILALSMGVPTVAISYQKKTDGIMEMLELSDYVLDMANLATCDILAAVERAWANRFDLRRQLSERIPNMEQLALRNAELIAKVLNRC
jgi:colanic acid/amylovoran biosynthesis protein